MKVTRLELLQVVIVSLGLCGFTTGCYVEDDHHHHEEERHDDHRVCPRCGNRIEGGVCVSCGYSVR